MDFVDRIGQALLDALIIGGVLGFIFGVILLIVVVFNIFDLG